MKIVIDGLPDFDPSYCGFCQGDIYSTKAWRWMPYGSIKIRVHISCYNRERKSR